MFSTPGNSFRCHGISPIFSVSITPRYAVCVRSSCPACPSPRWRHCVTFNRVAFPGSDGCEDGAAGLFETAGQDCHHQQHHYGRRHQHHQQHRQRPANEQPFHARQQPRSPAAVKQEPVPPYLPQQQPFGVFRQGECP